MKENNKFWLGVLATTILSMMLAGFIILERSEKARNRDKIMTIYKNNEAELYDLETPVDKIFDLTKKEKDSLIIYLIHNEL